MVGRRCVLGFKQALDLFILSPCAPTARATTGHTRTQRVAHDRITVTVRSRPEMSLASRSGWVRFLTWCGAKLNAPLRSQLPHPSSCALKCPCSSTCAPLALYTPPNEPSTPDLNTGVVEGTVCMVASRGARGAIYMGLPSAPNTGRPGTVLMVASGAMGTCVDGRVADRKASFSRVS